VNSPVFLWHLMLYAFFHTDHDWVTCYDLLLLILSKTRFEAFWYKELLSQAWPCDILQYPIINTTVVFEVFGAQCWQSSKHHYQGYVRTSSLPVANVALALLSAVELTRWRLHTYALSFETHIRPIKTVPVHVFEPSSSTTVQGKVAQSRQMQLPGN